MIELAIIFVVLIIIPSIFREKEEGNEVKTSQKEFEKASRRS